MRLMFAFAVGALFDLVVFRDAFSYGDRDWLGSHAAISTFCLTLVLLLFSYGPDAMDQFQHAAGYVDRILLVINLKTAKALGLQGISGYCGAAEEICSLRDFRPGTTDSQPPVSRECARGQTASDIEGPTDFDRVGLCFETEISRCALDSCMAQERSNRLQIARAFQDVESLRPA